MRQRLSEAVPAWLPGHWLIPDPSIVLVGAVLVTLVLAIRYAKQAGLDSGTMYRTGICAILGAFLGGRLLHILLSPEEFLKDPLAPFRILEEGKSVFGALMGAGLLAWLYLRREKIPFLAYADAAVPAIALGYATARVGCFLNGDDFGSLSTLPWAVQFPPGTEAYASHLESGWIQEGAALSLSVHPTQLYHAAAGLILLSVFRKWKGKVPGIRLAMAVISYGVIRFFLQFFRGNYKTVLLGLDISQIISLIFVVSGCLLIYRLKQQPSSQEQVFSLQSKAIEEK